MSGNCFTNSTARPTFGPTRLYAKKMSLMPTLASISASANVAHLCLMMPSSSSIRAISRVLCVLQCGRSRSGDLDHSPQVVFEEFSEHDERGGDDLAGVGDAISRVHERVSKVVAGKGEITVIGFWHTASGRTL